MPSPSFLDRSTWGHPNYLLIALAVVVGVALIPYGAIRAIRSNTNNVADWLPASFEESADLRWFVQQFGAQGFVVVSWDGCTLGDTRQLDLLAEKLAAAPLTPEVARATGSSPHPDRRLFDRVLSSTSIIARLEAPPTQLTRAEAIQRLEGTLVGPAMVAGDESTRTTCLLAYLSPHSVSSNRAMRSAIERLQQIAVEECGIPSESLHLGGPPVDNVTIDIEGERTLRTLAGLSGLVGLLLSFWCLRSWRLTGLVLVVAVLSAGGSLALVHYFGVFEVLALGRLPRLGRMDSVLMSMPALIYVLALSGAIHLVNYYRETRDELGLHGAVERAVAMAWLPCGLAALTTAIGLASLATSDILPIQKFGLLSAIGIMLALGLLFGLVPVVLHRFPPAKAALPEYTTVSGWPRRAAVAICRHHRFVTLGMVLLTLVCAVGLPQIRTSVKLLKLLDADSDLVQDYVWLEEHLGNLIPMEVVLEIPASHRRQLHEHSEQNGAHYAMSTFERQLMLQRLGDRIAELPEVGGVLSAATFGSSAYDSASPANRRTYENIVSRAIEENRSELTDYLRSQPAPPGEPASQSTELWRISARITALGDIDYGEFVANLQRAIAPVLTAYHRRDVLVATLNDRGATLAGSRIAFVTSAKPTEEDGLFYTLLREAGVDAFIAGQKGRLWPVSIDNVPADEVAARRLLSEFQAVVVLDDKVAQELARRGLQNGLIVDLSQTIADSSSPLNALCTGIVPVVFKTQRELLVSLQESLGSAFLLIALVMILHLRGFGAGIVSMIPNLFPIVVVFGLLGWMGWKIDIGTMMTASVALGVAVDDTVHFLSWFRRGLGQGLSRYDATLFAYGRCGRAMVQTTLIAGLGLVVFSFSSFVPTQQFGWLMLTILTAALVGDLVFLPALLVGPLGKFVRPVAPRDEAEATIAPTIPPLAAEPAEVPGDDPDSDPNEVLPTEEPPAEGLSPPHAHLHDRLRQLRRQAR